MKIAIIGAGIFGATIATVLAKNGFKVDLYEKENDIFTHASGINQYRVHRGYHYPRSEETILSCLEGEKEFREMYGESILDDGIEHYYCVAKKGTKVTGDECKKVFDKFSLEYEEKDSGIMNNNNISLSVKVKEFLFDPVALKNICMENIKKYGVNLLLNTEAKEELIKDYDLIIVTTYSDNNAWLKDYPEAQKNYQYEICEKLVLKLPEKFDKKSVVVFDGEFMCIDPFGKTGYFAMGNVVHAIHDRQIGKKVEIDERYKQVLNKGVIQNPPFTNYNKFIETAEEFFPGINKAEHIGSMFTIRTVLPYRDHDDARPTIVEQINGKMVIVFSGKIPSCVNAANQVLKIALNMNKKNMGVIGVGKWGKNLLRTFDKISEVKSCANKNNVDWINENHPSIKTTFNYRDILEDDSIDAVVISTPIDQLSNIAKEAIEKGKRVFIEKPMAKNSLEAKELLRLTDKEIFIGYIFLHHPIFKMIKKILEKDPLKEIEMSWKKFGTFEEDILLNLASHDLAIVLSLIDKELENSKIEKKQDSVSINLSFLGNINAKINIDRGHPIKSKEVLFETMSGKIFYWIDEKLFSFDKDKKEFKILHENKEEPLLLECREFINSLEEDITPSSNGKLGVKVLEIIDVLNNNLSS